MSLLIKTCCGCGSPALMTVGGGAAFENYTFNPGCSDGASVFVTSDGDPTLWEYNEESQMQMMCGEQIGARLIRSGVGDFDWEVFVTDEAEVTLARWELIHVWRPNCVNKFKLVEKDESRCGCNAWQPYICVSPHVPLCPETGIRSFIFGSNFPGLNYVGGSDCTIPRPLLENAAFFYAGQDVCPSFDGVSGSAEGCCWLSELDSVDGTCFGSPQTITATGAVRLDLFFRRLVVVVFADGPPGVPLGGVGTYVGPDGELSGNIVVTNSAAPFNSFTLTGFEFNINGQDCPATCVGPSRWYITREECEDSGEYLYSWALFDSDCGGQCFTQSCVPAIPETPELPSTPQDDTEAAALIALMPADPEDVQDNELFNGNCRCQEEYEAPVCCTGTSTWVLRRTFCPEAPGPGPKHIYYWEPAGSDCGGPCVDMGDACLERVPYPLEEEPIDEDEALNLGYLPDALDEEDDTGTCWCEEEYVPPECPECEDCDDVTGDKDFTIGGITGADSGFNGTYTLVKDEPDCRWVGDNGNPSFQATLEFFGTFWQLTFTDGSSTTYTLTSSDPCIDPIVLSKTSGATEFPATVTVDNV